MQAIVMINDLFDHMQWADAVVWQALFDLADVRDDSRIHELLYHIHMTQHGFLSVWEGRQFEYRKLQDFENLKAIAVWGMAFYDDLGRYRQANAAPPLERDLLIPWAVMFEKQLGAAARSTTLGETMLQLASHSTYHRGQVNARLRQLGAAPPLVDYIAWLWRGRPLAEWPDFRTVGSAT